MKALNPSLSQALKNISTKLADIVKAVGADTEKLKNIENKLGKIFVEFFKLMDKYEKIYVLHDQTENIGNIKNKMIEISQLLADGLDQIYNDIISCTSMDISADIEAFKGRMYIDGFSDEELDLYKLINNKRQK